QGGDDRLQQRRRTAPTVRSAPLCLSRSNRGVQDFTHSCDPLPPTSRGHVIPRAVPTRYSRHRAAIGGFLVDCATWAARDDGDEPPNGNVIPANRRQPPIGDGNLIPVAGPRFPSGGSSVVENRPRR